MIPVVILFGHSWIIEFSRSWELLAISYGNRNSCTLYRHCIPKIQWSRFLPWYKIGNVYIFIHVLLAKVEDHSISGYGFLTLYSVEYDRNMGFLDRTSSYCYVGMLFISILKQHSVDCPHCIALSSFSWDEQYITICVNHSLLRPILYFMYMCVLVSAGDLSLYFSFTLPIHFSVR